MLILFKRFNQSITIRPFHKLFCVLDDVVYTSVSSSCNDHFFIVSTVKTRTPAHMMRNNGYRKRSKLVRVDGPCTRSKYIPILFPAFIRIETWFFTLCFR